MINDTPETIIIQLTQGQSTIIDAKHADLAELKWYALKMESGYYAARRFDNKVITMGRVLMSRMLNRPLEKHERVDHKNGDPLCNLESNLRLCTQAQNNRNSKRPSTNKSGYKGVSWYERDRKWRARISINNRTKFLGSFHTREEAFECYKEAAIKYYGEFARLE